MAREHRQNAIQCLINFRIPIPGTDSWHFIFARDLFLYMILCVNCIQQTYSRRFVFQILLILQKKTLANKRLFTAYSEIDYSLPLLGNFIKPYTL